MDFTESGMAIQSWINNITLSLQNVCFVLTESQPIIENSSESSVISFKVDTDTGKIINCNNQNYCVLKIEGHSMRSIVQYEQNSSHCHIGNFEIPQRTVYNNENITVTVILAPCNSEQCPTGTSNNYYTPSQPSHDMTGESPTIIINIVG